MLFGLATSNLRSFRDFYLSLLNKSSKNEDYKRGYREALDDMVNLGTVTIQEQIDNLPDVSVSTDNLKDYLLVYSADEIQQIRDNKMQLVTVSEFQQVHREKLTAENKVEKLQERCDRYEKALTEIREAYTNYKSYDPDEDDGYAGGDVTSSFIDEVGEALAAIGGDDEFTTEK
ncbi:hypothetical protein [Lactococcus protaetiae]|uniref:Uncharacterized protein n=1 Tax=Lactococcus protaetiae TaxID=2592653 RepID=A0A514ZA64_9LACT|nr:hypothetical protein [Lactococcus protaetiae]QDK71482.1 hypothetical protein FLP15_10300 [Lactococcus protaetiae]